MECVCPKCHRIETNCTHKIKCPSCGAYMEIWADPLVESMKKDIRNFGLTKTWYLIEEKNNYKLRLNYRTIFFQALKSLGLKFYLTERK